MSLDSRGFLRMGNRPIDARCGLSVVRIIHIGEMKIVKKSVVEWGHNDRHQCQKYDAAKQTVESGEQFAADRIHRIDRSHPCKNH